MTDIAKMILESIDTESNKTLFADKLITKAHKMQQKIDVIPPKILSETDLKVKNYRELEQNNELAYMDYDSWCALNYSVKKNFYRILDPLFYSGVYFNYKTFADEAFNVLHGLDPKVSFYVLTHGQNHQCVCFHTDYSPFNWIGINKMKEIEDNFKIRVIRGFGMSANGLVSKEFK